LPSAQPLNGISLIWQHFSNSERHIQASSCTITLSFELQFEKIQVALSDQLFI